MGPHEGVRASVPTRSPGFIQEPFYFLLCSGSLVCPLPHSPQLRLLPPPFAGLKLRSRHWPPCWTARNSTSPCQGEGHKGGGKNCIPSRLWALAPLLWVASSRAEMKDSFRGKGAVGLGPNQEASIGCFTVESGAERGNGVRQQSRNL